MKKCPYCDEDIQDGAKKCRYCGEWIDKPNDMSETKKISIEYFDKGKNYQKSSEYDKAIDNLTQAIRYKHDYADAYYYRGHCYWELGKYNEAIEDSTQAIKFGTGEVSAGAYNTRGTCYWKLGKYNEAIEDLTQAIKYNKSNIRGVVFGFIGLKDKSYYGVSYSYRGNCYLELGKYNEAINDYTQAIKYIPDFAVAYSGRGYCYGELGKYNEGINDYNEAIKYRPDDPMGYFKIGYLYLELGKYKEAIRDLTLAIKYIPDDNKYDDKAYAGIYCTRGSCYMKLKKHEKAIEDYNRAIKYESDFARAYYERGNCYSQLEKYEEAIDDLTQAIRYKSDYAYAYYHRGICYKKLGKYNEAIGDLTQAIGYYNIDNEYILNLTMTYLERGSCYGRLGEHDKAKQDYAKIKELSELVDKSLSSNKKDVTATKDKGLVNGKDKVPKGEDKVVELIIKNKESGTIVEYKGDKIHLRKNSEIGDQYIIKGKGYESDSGGKNGDLIYVIADIEENDLPKGEDKIVEVIIESDELGKVVEYNGHKIHLRKNSKIGDTYVIEGEGYKNKSGGENGDLIYVIKDIE